MSKNITIYSPIPIEKYREVSNVSTFGNNSLIENSIIPDYFQPKDIKVLSDPVIQDGVDQVNYTWENITIGPMSAVIVAYSNYYGNGAEIYKTNQIDLPSASITQTYASNDSAFIMNYSIKNTGALRLDAPTFTLFFPEKVNGTQLIIPSNVTINSSEMYIIGNLLGHIIYIDGTGNSAKGDLIHSNASIPNYLDVNQQVNYPVEVTGTIENAGKIIPSFIIWYAADSDPYNTRKNDEDLASNRNNF